MDNLIVRWLAPVDKKGVIDVSVAAHGDKALSIQDLQTWREAIGVSCEACVTMKTHEVIGYVIYRSVPHFIELIDIAGNVAAWEKILYKIVEKVKISNRKGIIMHVRETEVPTQLKLKERKFRAVKSCREWFKDTGEDAIIFELEVETLTNQL